MASYRYNDKPKKKLRKIAVKPPHGDIWSSSRAGRIRRRKKRPPTVGYVTKPNRYT
jgi:hypothetical protein